MAGAATKTQALLAWLLVIVASVLVAAGTLWYGTSAEVHSRLWRHILERPTEAMSFRFILQPCMAMLAAVKDGIWDARTGRPPYFWTVLSNPPERPALLREGLMATAQIMLLAIAIDAVYQLTVFKTFYPAEAVVIAILLAFIPYMLLRGPVARIARRLGVGPLHSTEGPSP
jgi:hypothetical protein